MRSFGWLVRAAVALAFEAPAEACFGTDLYAYVHSGLPRPLPRGAIVADVAFEQPPAGDFRTHLLTLGIRARVRRMVQGDYAGAYVIVRPVTWSSCDGAFVNGDAGIIVTVPRRIERGVLVLDPLKVRAGQAYRLPDGFEVPQETFQRAALPPLAPPPPERSFVPQSAVRTAGLLLLASALIAWTLFRLRRK